MPDSGIDMQSHSTKSRYRREAVIAAVLFFTGALLLPIAVWLIGSSVFGAYAGDGFGGFYGGLVSRLVSGSSVAWFMILSPLLGVVVLRLTALAFRKSGG